MVEPTVNRRSISATKNGVDTSISYVNRHIGTRNTSACPLITIGLPVFNGATTLGGSLETLVAQDYPNLQIIISDNASTDGTLAICEEFAQRDSRIRIIQKQVNEGAVANFRTVLEAADGEFFMWAAADDYWHPQFVSRLLPLLEKDTGVGVAMCAIERRYPDGAPFDVLRFIGSNDPNRLGYARLFLKSFSNVKYSLFIYGIFRTNILKQAMPSFSEVVGGDRQFMSHLALACRFAYFDEVLHIRTYQPKNEENYRAKMARPGVLTHQMRVFIQTILTSPIIPWWRKPLLLPILPSFLFFNFKQTPMGRKMKFLTNKTSQMLSINRYFYLSRRASFTIAIGVAALAVGTTSLLMMKALPAATSLIVGTVVFLQIFFLALLVRRWIIESQKATLSSIARRYQDVRKKAVTIDKRLLKANRNIESVNDRVSKELRYLSDTLLNPELSAGKLEGNKISQYVIDRIEKHRKVVGFARNLEESQIREVYLQELFPEIQNESVPIGVINEQSGHANKTDMLYVSAIAKFSHAEKIFEFGTYMGRTTYYLAYNNPLAEVFTLNLSPESDPRYAPYLGVLFKDREEAKRIKQLYSDSRDFDTTNYRHQFDFVFVDGDHSYDLVKNDTRKAFELLKPGGIIMWHDYAPKSEGLVRFFREFTQERPLFRIRSTCLLIYIDGVDVMNHKLAELPFSLELELRENNPYLVESIYHS